MKMKTKIEKKNEVETICTRIFENAFDYTMIDYVGLGLEDSKLEMLQV